MTILDWVVLLGTLAFIGIYGAWKSRGVSTVDEYMRGGGVVLRGPTGRNFAPGMSGGLACIWDPDDAFEPHCNLEMVDLEPVHPDGNEFLHRLITEHQRRTGSTVAAAILERWAEAVDEFTVVIPPGFRAALAHTAPPAKARTVNLA